ncbi:hypothetical protein B0H16DRAFT_1339328, partial [Mycena metata]
SFQELLMHVSRQLHTLETIEEGRAEMQLFGQLIKVFFLSWNFPKMHSQLHVFDDIQRKGVTKNYGTKPDESMHGFTRQVYLHQTNFKDVEAQVIL